MTIVEFLADRLDEDAAKDADPTPLPCDTLLVLVSVYSDHPEFEKEWTPR